MSSGLITDRRQIAQGIRILTHTRHEAPGLLGGTPDEQFVRRAAICLEATANVIVTMGLSKGWRFRCLPGDFVDLWAPAVWKPVTYTVRNAALWRAIKKRGVSLA